MYGGALSGLVSNRFCLEAADHPGLSAYELSARHLNLALRSKHAIDGFLVYRDVFYSFNAQLLCDSNLYGAAADDLSAWTAKPETAHNHISLRRFKKTFLN